MFGHESIGEGIKFQTFTARSFTLGEKIGNVDFFFDQLNQVGGKFLRFDDRFGFTVGGKFFDHLNDGFEMFLTEFQTGKNFFFGNLIGAGFDHGDGAGAAGNDQVETTSFFFFFGGINQIFTSGGQTEANGTDRTTPGEVADGQSGRGADEPQDFRFVHPINREWTNDNLDLIKVIAGKQRADRAVDQTGGENLVIGGTAFSFDETTAADNTAGVMLFAILDLKGEIIQAFGPFAGDGSG